MRTNTLTILAAIVAVLLSVSAWLLVRPTNRGDEEDPCFKNMAVSSVMRLVRTKGAGTEELIRTNGGWLLGDVPVRADEVDAFLQNLGEVAGTQVARNGRDVPVYGLQGSDAVTLSLVTAVGTTTCDVGRTDPATGGVYVAPGGSGGVYLVRGTTLGSFVRANWDAWHNSSSSATGTVPQR